MYIYNDCVRNDLLTEDAWIAMSMPGIGAISASSILAEIGDYNNFDSPNKLVSRH